MSKAGNIALVFLGVAVAGGALYYFIKVKGAKPSGNSDADFDIDLASNKSNSSDESGAKEHKQSGPQVQPVTASQAQTLPGGIANNVNNPDTDYFMMAWNTLTKSNFQMKNNIPVRNKVFEAFKKERARGIDQLNSFTRAAKSYGLIK